MHFLLSFFKNASPTFSMVHFLLHRLYGVDSPDRVFAFFDYQLTAKQAYETTFENNL